jgi:hypothetical protein
MYLKNETNTKPQHIVFVNLFKPSIKNLYLKQLKEIQK